MSGGRILARMLEAYGVTHVFFVPAMLKRTLAELEDHTSIGRILAHSEKAAAYMADGYARASGRPGICMAQLVGAANLAAGLRDAYLGCSPVIAMTGGPTAESAGRLAYQQVADRGVFAPFTKFAARVDSVERLPDLLRQAFRVATVSTPGPVHLEFAGRTGADIDTREANVDIVTDTRHARLGAFRPVADSTAVAEAARLLRAADRPVIIAGGGVRLSGAEEEVIALAETVGAPVATSLNGKGIIPDHHPLAVGVVGLYSRACANRTVLEADCVFYVGSQTGGQVTLDWSVPRAGTQVIQLDINPEQLGRHYPAEVALCGDAKATLAEMANAFVGHTPTDAVQEWIKRTRGFVEDWRQSVKEVTESDGQPVRPERVAKELGDVLPADGMIVSDTGHSGIWTGALIDLRGSNQSYIRAAGSLGWAFPAGLGAKLAVGKRPVVVFTGDGGFWYHLSELETAVRWKIPIVVIVNNNRSLNQEMESSRDAYAAEHRAQHTRHTEMWHFGEVDFAQVARALGAGGIRVKRGRDLKMALEEALTAAGPVVVDVVTDIEAIAPPAYRGV